MIIMVTLQNEGSSVPSERREREGNDLPPVKSIWMFLNDSGSARLRRKVRFTYFEHFNGEFCQNGSERGGKSSHESYISDFKMLEADKCFEIKDSLKLLELDMILEYVKRIVAFRPGCAEDA